ncbi:hypothetical protein IAT38_000405 [Cryptococcus sp. DSM 104549]
MPHNLYTGHPPPSREVLEEWLEDAGVFRAPELDICEMEDGEGWRVVARDELDLGELICSIPKTAILSPRSSSLPPIMAFAPPSTSHSILHLALCLLHELRLEKFSRFHGYLQSLPRDMSAALPAFWGLDNGDEETDEARDGRLGSEWLRGTEAEREIEKKAREGLALPDIRQFYTLTASHLPSTPTHSGPSPFSAFVHAYSLVSSRAFLIDLYHTIALCPFADILNHTSDPHTCLASDDFVCHLCGSLAPCEHDGVSAAEGGVPGRLSHLPELERQRLSTDVDRVEMRVEREVEAGEEVWNSYGEEVGDGRLLAEWGFIGEEFADYGLTWDWRHIMPTESSEGGSALSEAEWEPLARQLAESMPQGPEEDEDDSLLCPQSTKLPTFLNLDQSGRLSRSTFALLWIRFALSLSKPLSAESNDLVNSLRQAIVEAESAWRDLEEDGGGDEAEVAEMPRPSEETIGAARACRSLLRARLESMHRPEASQEELFTVRDNLDPVRDKRQRLAMTLAINERGLLYSALEKWKRWVDVYGAKREQ